MWNWLRPRSIFASIYGGILLVIVTVGACTYGMVSYINGQRVQHYNEAMATALFHITAIAVARQAEDNRDLWLQDASALLGLPVRLITTLPFKLTVKDDERLRQGLAIVKPLSDDKSEVWVRVPVPGPSLFIHAELAGIGEKQARAAATFFLEDLSNYPGQEALRLKTLSPFVGFNMTLIPSSRAGLDSDQLRRLGLDEIVVRFRALTSSGRSAITVYAPSQLQRNQVLRLGPVELFESQPTSLLVIASVLALLLITLGAYLVVHIFEIKITIIEDTVKRLREGDLSARAQLTGRDELARLADTLNQMANHTQRLLNAQSELTQAVSHELRTPLARLRFGVEMLADTEDFDSRQEQLERLDEDVSQLNQLIDEILTYANLEKTAPGLDFERVDVHELMRRIERETQALRLPIDLVIQVEPGLVVDAIPRYLHRIIQNLVGNGMRYAKTQVRVTLRSEHGVAELLVEDDGPGIPESERARVFEPFTRLDDSRTRSTGGYGLGLSIVRRIVLQFAGTIRVDASADLKGACFVMSWPIKRRSP